MAWGWILFLAVLFVAFANGANDNFKGVATLLGSGTTDYPKALAWATLTTFAGSVTAYFFAARLVQAFTGRGLVPEAFLGNPTFLVAVAIGAGLTVLFTACGGIPISTTHGLTGALAGAGFVMIGSQFGFEKLGKSFFLPLFFSPVLAMVLTVILYSVMHQSRKILGVTRKTCLCVGEKVIPLADLGLEGGKVLAASEIRIPEVMVGKEASCRARAIETYEGKILGISAQSVLDGLHFLSAGAVSFARGLNDTPKIVALLVAADALGFRWPIGLVALGMAAGGILGARRVAETLSHRITAMNHGQGFSANLVTAFLVIAASHLGLPVSTTHVSCGALFGIGLVSGQGRWDAIGTIWSAWILTLPLAAILSGGSYWIFSRIGGWF